MRSTDNIPALRRLWKQCFEADSSFLDLFFGQGFKHCRTFTLERDGGIVSALSVFPIYYKGIKGGYIYGVCTAPSQRGHGYAITLLREAEQHCVLDDGMEFFILRPASPSLFGYYKKQGYSYNIYRHRELHTLPLIPARIEISPLSAGQYYNLRHKYYYRSGLIEWTEDTCDYILSYIDYCQGQAVEINNGESYLLSYPSPENNEIIVCEEAGLELQAENLPTILSAIRTLYPNAAKTLLDISTQSPKEDFLLCKPAHHIPGGSAFFSFTME